MQVAPEVLSLVVNWMDADLNAVDCKKGVGFKRSKWLEKSSMSLQQGGKKN